MKIREIYEILNELSDFSLQDEWDNSGLLVGNFDTEFDKVYLSLDIDSKLVESMDENSLLITHHPLIFKGLKRVDFVSYPSNILKEMILKNISLVSMHTNFDKTHLNRYVLEKILGFECLETDGYISYFETNLSFENLCNLVKDRLKIKTFKIVKAKDYVKRCAITTGSGGDLIDVVKADCFLSGDFKYHQALAAKESGMSLIEIGHYESEKFFAECLYEYLKNLSLKVIMSSSKNPFEYR